MKEKLIILLTVVQFSSLGSAAILKLAGRVPDRGYVLNEGRIEPAKNSEVKIFVSEKPSNQTAHQPSHKSSHQESHQESQWRQIRQSETLSTAAKIRVQAP